MVLAALLASPLVSTLAGGFAEVPGKHEVTVLLTRVMLPFLPLVSCAAVAMGMLNAEQRYVAPALSPALFNVVTIAWAAGLWQMGLPAEQVALGWALGTVLGGAAQFLIQVPALRRGGWRFRAEWVPGDPGIRQIAVLMGPATLGLAAVQINIFLSSYFASHEPSAVSWLNYAFRLLYLPIGLFGVAVSTIATTGLARRAAAGDMEGLRRTLIQALRLLAFLTVPSTAGLMVLAVPIIRLLYERGAFTPADTPGTATALVLYSLGLVAYTAVKVLAPAFYALGIPRVPLLGSAMAVATNLMVILILHPTLGFRAVALGVSAGAWVNVLVLGAVFQRRVGGLLGQGLAGLLARLITSAVILALAARGALGLLERSLGTSGLSAQLLTALVPVGAGIVTYGLLTHLFRVPEAGAVGSLIRRRRSQP
jgi:putative peptidoglycan lipid II flippase